MPELRQLKERMRATDTDAEALCMAHRPVGELRAEHASLAVGSERAKAECDILANFIRKLRVDAAMRDRE